MTVDAPCPPRDSDDEAAWRRSPPTRRDVRTDAWITAGLLVLGALTWLLSSVVMRSLDGGVTGPVESAAWLLALTAPVAFRRRWPVAVMVVVSLAVVGSELRGYPDGLAPSLAVFLVIYTANAWGRSRRTALVASVVVTAVVFAWLAVSVAGEVAGDQAADGGDVGATAASIAYVVVFNGIFFVSAVYFGRSSRVSAARLHALERAGVDLRAAQEIVADQAIGEERTRIARELHDVVAHHVAVIGIQAGAARRTLDRPEIARGALAAVESTARTTIDELERLLSVLRARDHVESPSPSGPAALPQLVADTRRLGLDVRLSVEGSACDVPDSVGVTVYRVAQEALTNTLKHAGASSAVVSLRYRDRAVELEVSDDGRGAPATSTAPATGTTGAGLGQRGMRERVDLHGGVLQVGPLPRGGYRVHAVLPVTRSRSRSDEGAEPWRSVGDLGPRPR